LLLAGCQGLAPRDSSVQQTGFSIDDLAKSDIDLVAETTVRQSLDYLQQLAVKLYRRNPAQLRRGGYAGDADAVARELMGVPGRAMRAPWQGKRSADLIVLGFQPDYPGDRVATLVYGLRSMLADAYGGEQDFYLNHEYDPQKIYFLARNLEIADWRLRNRRDAQGRLFLLSVGQGADGVINASFERLVGKLVALQDHFAQVVADSSNRRIKNVIQSVATAVFFPI
jgi:hypothetical protein